MNTRYLMALVLGLTVMVSAQGQNAEPQKTVPAKETAGKNLKPEQQGRTQCDVTKDKQQCCSARNCSGNVLSNRDAHNCIRTGGHSWHPASEDGGPAVCTNL